MQCIKQYIYLFFILFNLLSCSDQLNAQTYSASGVSLSIPDAWKFVKDSYYKGNRTISFTTGEFSGASLTIFPKDDPDFNSIERTSFVDNRVINILTSGLSISEFKETRKPISRSPFTGEQVLITYKSPGRDSIVVESYLLLLDEAKIIVIIDTEKSDLPNVSNKIEGFLKSISYNPNLAAFDKDKIH